VLPRNKAAGLRNRIIEAVLPRNWAAGLNNRIIEKLCCLGIGLLG
jgi:hypothetical protein